MVRAGSLILTGWFSNFSVVSTQTCSIILRRPPLQPGPLPPPPPPPRMPEKMSRARSQKEPSAAPSQHTGAKSSGPGNTQNSRPGWRSVKSVPRQRRPTVEPINLESGSIGLLGPSTPRETSLLDVEPSLEPNLISTEVDSKGEPPRLMTVTTCRSLMSAPQLA